MTGTEPLYYDRQGQPIDFDGWVALHQPEPDAKRVAQDTIGDLWVDTIWTGINMHPFRWGDHPPVIFETQVFANSGTESPWDLYIDRYATEDEARKGHASIVASIRAGKGPYDHEGTRR